jgi:type IX secretion system PorP/SprF family membrane protein
MKKSWLTLLLGLIFGHLMAQDTQYSQFYAAPIYLNPAFTGAAETTRIGLNYRNQWPGLNQKLLSYSAFIDHYFQNKNSGIGLIINRSEQSNAALHSTEIGASYAYRLRIGQNSFLRMGGQASYSLREGYLGDLIFGSQIDPISGAVSDFSGENLYSDPKIQFMDYGFGILYYNSNAWIGVSGHHLTAPNLSYLEDYDQLLPRKFSVHGGLRWDIESLSPSFFSNQNPSTRALIFAFNYKNQRPFSQLDLGIQADFKPLFLGVWYRGIPLGGIEAVRQDAVIGLVGFSLDAGIDIGYSYDFTISSLTNAQSSGAHEISLRFSLGSKQFKSQKQISATPCFQY